MWLLKNRLLHLWPDAASSSGPPLSLTRSPSNSPTCPVCGHQVFVEYVNSSDSKEAQRLLTGRTFDGKFVVATFYPLSAYRRGYLYQTVQWAPDAQVTPLHRPHGDTQPTQSHEWSPCSVSSDDSVISNKCSEKFCMWFSTNLCFVQSVNWTLEECTATFIPLISASRSNLRKIFSDVSRQSKWSVKCESFSILHVKRDIY